MSLIKKIKRFLGLELPYLLKEEETRIEVQGNILIAPEEFYKSEKWEKTIEQFNQAMILSGTTMNENRERLGVKKL